MHAILRAPTTRAPSVPTASIARVRTDTLCLVCRATDTFFFASDHVLAVAINVMHVAGPLNNGGFAIDAQSIY